MKISELLEELGQLQGEHGDIEVLLADNRCPYEMFKPTDKVQKVELADFVENGSRELCVAIYNY